MLRVVVAEDALLVRAGIASLLEEAGFLVVGLAENADELLALVESASPRVVVVDIRLPPGQTDEGLRAAAEIRERHPDLGVLVLSQHLETGYAAQLFERGARGLGYLLKDNVLDLREFAGAVRRVAAGGSAIDPEVVERMVQRRRRSSKLDDLTERQRTVLSLMAQGRSNQAIGERLALTPRTVEAHIRGIFAKLELEPTLEDHRRVLAVLAYLRS